MKTCYYLTEYGRNRFRFLNENGIQQLEAAIKFEGENKKHIFDYLEYVENECVQDGHFNEHLNTEFLKFCEFNGACISNFKEALSCYDRSLEIQKAFKNLEKNLQKKETLPAKKIKI